MAWWDALLRKRPRPGDANMGATPAAPIVASDKVNISLQEALNRGGSTPISPVVKEAYSNSDVVYACVSFICSMGSSIPIYVQKREKDGTYKRVPNHPAERILSYPNEMMSGQDLKEYAFAHSLLKGNSIWYLVPSIRGGVNEIWPVMPDCVKPVQSERTVLSHYEFRHTSMAKPEVWKPSSVVHHQLFNPKNFFWGMSPLVAGEMLVDTDIESMKFMRNSLRNRCVKDGLLAFKHDLTDDQYKKVTSVLRDQVLGSFNPRAPLVLGHEASYTPYSMTPMELDLVNSKQMSARSICRLFGVPPILLGDMDNSSYNNIKTARLIFWLDRLIPFMDNFIASLNTQLILYWYEAGMQPGDLEFACDYSRVEALLEGLAAKVKIGLDLFQIGYTTNEINDRLQLGMPESEAGDQSFISKILGPSGGGQQAGNSPSRPPGDPTGAGGATKGSSLPGESKCCADPVVGPISGLCFNCGEPSTSGAVGAGQGSARNGVPGPYSGATAY